MADPGIEKILHAAENDVALLKRDFGFAFASVFDTELAARLCGRAKSGLDSLLEAEMGIRHSKELQRSDWSRRPLSPPQERYAADDVRHLATLRDRLREELRAKGREAWLLEEGTAVAAAPPAPVREPADFFRLKGAWELSPRDLAVLRELTRMREEWAQRLDRPLFKVCGDGPLVEIAVRKPRDQAGLGAIKGMPRGLVERRSREILDAVRKAEGIADSELPVRERTRGPRMKWEASRRVDRLKAWRLEAAARLGLDPGLLLPQRLIERIAIDAPADLAALEAVPEIRRWRIEALGAELLGASRG
jgi:ribonuclease D